MNVRTVFFPFCYEPDFQAGRGFKNTWHEVAAPSSMLVSGFPSPAAPGNDEAVCGVADFTPGAIAYGIAGKEWTIHGGELDLNPNRLFALREFARDEKFVVAKSAIGGLLSGEHQWDPRPS
jgi:hypothetical protein